MSRLARIAISIGDPAGVGAEIALKALQDQSAASLAHWLLIADAAALNAAARVCGIDPAALPCTLVETGTLAADHAVAFGQLRAEYGLAAIAYVRRAVELCMNGEAEAMVTAPLTKRPSRSPDKPSPATPSTSPNSPAPLSRACCSTPTSWQRCTSARIFPWSRPAASTAHKSSAPSGSATTRSLWLRSRAPRIAVCGLNPHAGEHGLFGRQDADIIAPAIEEARALGIDCSGPHSPDTIFVRALRGEFDLVVAMYHDQGHIPMKLIDFEGGVNVSLGLPIIRTSVDHGTAFDIAGRNQADPTNMKAAMRLAVRMAEGKFALAGAPGSGSPGGGVSAFPTAGH